MQYPYVLLNKLTVFLLILTVAVFGILVKLGLWQLARGEEKTVLQAQMEARQSLLPLSFEQLQLKVNKESVTGYRLQVQATPASSQIWLLDNQIYQGQVGYLAFQPLQVEAGKPWLLVELGFVAAGSHRGELPQITPLSGELILEGRLYQKQINPLSQSLMAESGANIRFQNLNIPEMSQMLGHPLLPAVLQPDELPTLALPHPWQPFPLPAQKHWGYALQWFSMAAVFAGLMLWQGIKYVKRQSAETIANSRSE
ncbi:cytochrome C oxidase biogenesis protein [Shewanella sp. Pdp11]|uniref:SURF1 family protein n=1 Tax=Shewanella sp. Pdp11 TaxID=2059264 RepID=UPI000CA1A31D|nr:SURF1 family protein [Shewanella sp. Pdp11]AUD58615.1 cytochrome C oxidase biogenesis protein [Shewanella sp. Pdp11]